jgi:hypothetical protein
VANSHSSRRQLVEQRRHGGRYVTVSGYDNCPSQILAESLSYDAPSIERRRCRRADLNHRPVSNQGERILSAWQWTADDEMVVPMHKNADHHPSLRMS